MVSLLLKLLVADVEEEEEEFVQGGCLDRRSEFVRPRELWIAGDVCVWWEVVALEYIPLLSSVSVVGLLLALRFQWLWRGNCWGELEHLLMLSGLPEWTSSGWQHLPQTDW